MSKIFVMCERQVHVCRRTISLPPDFDQENDDHLQLLEDYFDGQDWDREEIVSGELTVEPLNTTYAEQLANVPELSWEDLNDD